MSAPMTQVNICVHVDLDNRYQHTIYFSSPEEQQRYFAGKVIKSFPAYSHHRREWELKVEATVSSAQGWNYLYIENPGMKPYYYFINKVEYVNDTTVKLFLELDVIQTHLFSDAFLLPCFVERQHTESDKVGEHTIPEALEIGDYWNYHIYNEENLSDLGILVLTAAEWAPTTSSFTSPGVVSKAKGNIIDGLYNGLAVYAFNDWENLETYLTHLEGGYGTTGATGGSDSVIAIWMYPKKLVKLSLFRDSQDLKDWDEIDWTSIYNIPLVRETQPLPVTLANYTNYEDRLFGGYASSVKNNKLFTYPYNMLYVTNNQGDTAEYKFEKFPIDSDCYFEAFGGASPASGVKLVPNYYNSYGGQVAYDEGLTLGSYPTCAWDSDTYKVWLSQNYNQLSHSIDTAGMTAVGGLASLVAGAVTFNPMLMAGGAGAIYGGLNQISGIMAQKEDAKAQPPQAKGTYSTSVNASNGRQTFTFYYKCIRKEFARQIDDYFTMFGYKVNRLQKPNIKARPAFTYVKTVGCKVVGYIGNEDINKIASIFDNGVTFWVDGDKLGDYSQDNTV